MLPACFEAIGSDRYLHESELVGAIGDQPVGRDAWRLYQEQFGGFCETTLDPMFHRLSHPARTLGTLVVPDGAPVLVVGTGPSTDAAIPDLIRLRRRLHLVTSPRGAEHLARHGLVPDLVLVEHQTALDAHHSARHAGDAPRDNLTDVPLVAADWRTPASALARVAADRLFVPAPLPSWGLWPATLVAMAAVGGAGRIGLLGIDLGSEARPDVAFAPLRGLLGLLAGASGIEAVDCGAGGARKDGWRVDGLDTLAASATVRPLALDVQAAPSRADRRVAAASALQELRPVVEQSNEMLRAALEARAGRVDRPALLEAAETLRMWGEDVMTRVQLQEVLGVSFLPRFWRTGIDSAIGDAIWRPVLLATHELTAQAARLDADFEALAA